MSKSHETMNLVINYALLSEQRAKLSIGRTNIVNLPYEGHLLGVSEDLKTQLRKAKTLLLETLSDIEQEQSKTFRELEQEIHTNIGG